jgi:hypothetical protein
MLQLERPELVSTALSQIVTQVVTTRARHPRQRAGYDRAA